MKKNNFVVAASLGFAQLALLSTVAIGQENPVPTNSPTRELDEVVVTASRSPRKQSEIGKIVRVINAEQLSKSQGRTLPEVLNNVAGITLSGAGNNQGSVISVFTRGASSGNTLILIDGIPANNASEINNSYDISSFAIDQIERVEILRGGNSTLYGSDAVAGVINIITKKPGTEALNGNVILTGGTYNTFKEAIALNGSVGRTSVAANFSNTSADGFSVAKDQSGTGNFDNDGFKQQAFNAHLKQQFTDKFSVQGNVQITQNMFGLDDGAFADDNTYTGKNVYLFAGLNAKYLLPKGAIDFIVNQNDVKSRFFDADGLGNFSKTVNKGNITYTEAILTTNLVSNLDLTAGVNYRDTKTDQTYESVSTFGPYNSYLSQDIANNNIFSSYASLFFKASGFNFELGGRYNNHSDYGNNFTYTINPSYVIANRFKFFVGLSSAFKAPSLYQLTSEYASSNGLDPETTRSYEAGTDLELVPSKVSLSITGFIRDTKDIIYFFTDPATFSSEYRNGNKQDDKGFEIELTSRPVNKLTFNAWYAYVKGKGTDAGGSEITYLLRRPKNTFGANAGYEISKSVSFTLIYKHTGNRLDPFGYPTVNINQKAFSLFDVYAQYKPVNKLTLFADVKNLLDEKYTEWEGYNTRGTNFNAGLKYDLK